MKIELKEISVREVVDKYKDSADNGVVGFGGKLNIRPAYQREFVYKDKQRNAVIETVSKDFPLNVMYWVKNGEDTYEVLDGQQRTISICQYINGDFAINYKYFHNLTEGEKTQILDYKLMVYICEGTDKEKLEWFTTINIAGEKLTPQELRNAVYTGEWLTDAKRHFSKRECPAYCISEKYINAKVERQEYLEVALKWISDKKNCEIEDYMAKHQHTSNANELWVYFQNVINWVKITFPTYRKEMKGVDWGRLYNKYKDNEYNSESLEKKIKELMEDDDVTNKKGIYEYLLSEEEKYLNIRTFTPKMKRETYEKQNGVCPSCGEHFEFDEMEGDHITPWHLGGKTNADNCQMLCKACNRRKGGK